MADDSIQVDFEKFNVESDDAGVQPATTTPKKRRVTAVKKPTKTLASSSSAVPTFSVPTYTPAPSPASSSLPASSSQQETNLEPYADGTPYLKKGLIFLTILGLGYLSYTKLIRPFLFGGKKRVSFLSESLDDAASQSSNESGDTLITQE